MIKLALSFLLFCLPCISQVEISLCETNNLRLQADVVNGNYYWLNNGLFIGQNDLSIHLSDTGMMLIELVAYSNYGCEKRVKEIVHVLDCENLFIPNSFTPNNDGLNDYFGPVTNVKEWNIEIYDRWGGLIYKGSSPWGGNGVQDIYVYKLAWIENKKIKIVNGRVTLVL